jgi:tetratricopeptide (TPR) repeat protein
MRTVLHGLALLVLVLLPAARAAEADAVAAYRAGDLATARAAWLAALERADVQGAERARVLYDLGNVAWREGHKLEAVGWYTASLRLRPRDADTWANLEHARREAGLDPADRGDLGATLRRLASAWDGAEARLLALLGLALWAAALAFEALRGGRTARWVALLAFLAAAVLSVPWLHGALTTVQDPVLLVEETKALVRSEPRADAAVVAEVAAGSEVERLDALPGWVKLAAPDGTEGWVAAGSVFALRR